MKTVIKYLICSLMIFISSEICKAQTYQLLISTPEDDLTLGGAISFDDHLYLITWRGYNSPDSTNYYHDYRNIIYHIDENGSIMDRLILDTLDGFDISLRDVIYQGDTLLLWGSALLLDSNTIHLCLIWLNAELEIIDRSFIGPFSYFTEFIDHTEARNGELIFAGAKYIEPYDLILIKTDQYGNTIETESIPLLGSPWPGICYLPETGNIINNGIFRLDFLDYDLSWDTTYAPSIFNKFLGNGHLATIDSSHILAPGQIMKLVPPNGGRDIACILFDTTGQLIDSIIFELPYLFNQASNIDYIDPDTLFIGGTGNYQINTSPFFDPIDRWLVVFKFDLEENIFWERQFGGDGSYVTSFIKATSNGGCLLAGHFYDWRNNPIYERDIVIYKLNSEGLLTGIETPERQSRLLVYPNPGTESIRILSELDDIKLTLLNVIGQTILSAMVNSEDVISTSHLENGIYFYTIESDQKIIETGKWIKQSIH